MNDEQKRVSQVFKALSTPVVLNPGGWGTDLPAYWNDRVIRQRFEMLDRGAWDKATDAEVAMYLSSASMVAPLGRDWADIFIYYTDQLLGHGKVYDALGDDHRCRELTEYQKMEVENLKHRIRNSQIKNEPKISKGGTMTTEAKPTKIFIEERGDGTLIGVHREGVDPFTKTVPIKLADLLPGMPFLAGIVSFAEERWKVAPKDPPYVAPPAAVKPATTPAVKGLPGKTKKKGVKPAGKPVQVDQVSEAGVDTKPVIEAQNTPETSTTPPTVASEQLQQASEVKPVERQTHPFDPNKVTAEDKADLAKVAALQEPELPVNTKKSRVSSDAFQYKLKDGTGPFATIQLAMDALKLDPKTRPTHNRYDRLSKKLQEEILQEKKA